MAEEVHPRRLAEEILSGIRKLAEKMLDEKQVIEKTLEAMGANSYTLSYTKFEKKPYAIVAIDNIGALDDTAKNALKTRGYKKLVISTAEPAKYYYTGAGSDISVSDYGNYGYVTDYVSCVEKKYEIIKEGRYYAWVEADWQGYCA